MTRIARSLLLASLLLGAVARAQSTPAPDAPGAPARADVAPMLQRVDAAWPHRDEPGKMGEIRTTLEEAQRAAPDDFGVLWRLARLYFWLSDDPAIPDDEKSRLGKKAWEYGDRASAANPDRVEGWYYAAVGMGNYSLGIGILKALGEGIEGKFKERLSRAEKLDPKYLDGGVYNAWGRFWYKLPWPKYDPKRSEQALQKSIEMNPANVRGRVYLAELYKREHHAKEATELLQEAAAHQPGAYDPPEERRSVAEAKKLLTGMR